MDYFEILRQRRSTRKFTEQPLDREALGRLIQAANASPVGSNLYRDIHLTVVQDRAVLDQLSLAAEKRRQDAAKMKEIAGETKGVDLTAKKYDPFYGAPAVFFISHRVQDLQPGIEQANAAIMAYSMHLAVTSLGLGSVIMWFALESMRELPELDNTSVLGLPEGFQPLIGLAVGHPAKQPAPREIPERISVDWL